MPDSSTSLVVARDGPADELAALVHQAARATFGATALITEVVLRTLGESAPARSADHPRGSLPASEAVDFVLGLGWGLAHVAERVAGLTNKVASPALSLALAPPLVPEKLHAARLLRRVSLTWKTERPDAVRSLYAWSASVAPAANDLALSLVDVDELLVQALARLDLQQVAGAALAQLDVDELMASAVAELDLTRLVEQVLAGLDLTPVVDKALDQMDLTDTVLKRVDLHRVIVSALEQLDLTQLILEQVDLVRVADVIVDGVDLPEIIRDSTGSMASETMHDVRLQGIDADRAVSRLVDRMLRRRREES
jgi:hypothetical protein